jgi:hypothetical protein
MGEWFDRVSEVASWFWSIWEVVVWVQGDEIRDGENGVSPFPLDVYPPVMHLDWVEDGREDEVLLLAILDANVSEEEFHPESMVATVTPQI